MQTIQCRHCKGPLSRELLDGQMVYRSTSWTSPLPMLVTTTMICCPHATEPEKVHMLHLDKDLGLDAECDYKLEYCGVPSTETKNEKREYLTLRMLDDDEVEQLQLVKKKKRRNNIIEMVVGGPIFVLIVILLLYWYASTL